MDCRLIMADLITYNMSKPKGSVSKKIEQKLKDYFAKIKVINDTQQRNPGVK